MTIEYKDSKRIVALEADRTGGSITLDAESNNHASASATSITISGFTVGNNSNKILIVSVGSYNPTPTVSGITWNSSENFTQINTVLNNGRADLWYLVNPTSTTADIVVTYSSSAGSRSVGVTSLYNVNQSTPIGVTNTATGTGGTIAGTITPTTTGSWIIDSAMSLTGLGAITDTLTAGFSNLIGGVDRSHGTQYSASPTINSANSMTWTNGQSSYAWAGAEIKKAEGDITNVQDNSLLVEKDTARRYWFTAESDNTLSYENTSAVSLGTVDSGTSIDLTGSTLDDSWVLRFKVTMTSLGTGSSLLFMVQNSTTTTVSTARDGIGLRQTDSSNYYDFEGCNNVAGNAGQYDHRFTTTPATDTKYVQITRTSATSAKIEFYDSTYTTVSESSGDITIADITGLRYFVITNNGSALTVDDIDFWNGVTSATIPATWTMQPTLEDDFSSDNFNDSGTKIGVANNTLEWDGAQNGSVHGSTIDLTSIDTKAVFRAKLRINTLTAPSSASSFILIGFSDSDHTTAGDSSQDGIGLIIQNDADVANTFRAMHVDGAVFSPNAGTAFATVPSTATDYFIEVVLDVNTWYVRIYSDSDYSTLTEEESGSLTATGLRYFGIKMRSSASIGGTFDGYIDDLKFYNGVTSIN